MLSATLKQAVRLAEQIGYVMVATADSNGVPHISAFRDFEFDGKDHVKLKGWFCQYTADNLDVNRLVSVVVWDPRQDLGYQLIGELERREELAVLDGYAPGLEKKHHMPQTESRIHIRVNKILGFKKAPHVDEAIV